MRYTADPALHLWLDGQRIEPYISEADVSVFRLTLPGTAPRLRSRSHRPSRTEALKDGRVLGYCVTSYTLTSRPPASGQVHRTVEAADLANLDGYHEWEPPGWIWTDGDAAVPFALLEGLQGEAELTVRGVALPRYPIDDDARLAAQQVMRSCISLGENCAFAFAQSHFDAEPLDLLRWAATTHDQLCHGLNTRFAALGDPGRVVLWWNDEGGEYRLVDPDHSSFHTQATARLDPAGQEAVLQETLHRIAFLRRKLLHDLAAGKRMGVFRTTDPAFRPDALQALHDAYRRLSPGPLLVLHPAEHPGDIGEVRKRAQFLFEGRFDPDAEGEAGHLGLQSLCTRAMSLRTQAS